jgi:hypothetical protein
MVLCGFSALTMLERRRENPHERSRSVASTWRNDEQIGAESDAWHRSKLSRPESRQATGSTTMWLAAQAVEVL